MTSCAIDEWITIFDAVDVSQEVKNNDMRHLRHVAGDLLGFLVVPLPLARNMAMGTTRAQRPAVTHLHNLQQIPRRHPSQDLDVLEDGFRWLVFFASDLLGEFGNFVVVECLDCFRMDGSSVGTEAFSCWPCAIAIASKGPNQAALEILGIIIYYVSSPIPFSVALRRVSRSRAAPMEATNSCA